ncbi:D-cysteine desulfhydrase [Actinidia rufa]|uniref:D-cysteine desulfhydrase n=1 Tax=Actinidia rufa TaxID=165716 RepID=A0A7J0FKG9_9ERIC|nr:D-cysteine desulfhydrase [Actinidia rufa]
MKGENHMSFLPAEQIPLGIWGYIEAIREIEQQVQTNSKAGFDDIVAACGSGGTIAGLAIGSQLSNLKANAKGIGYAMNTTEELKFVKEIAEATGVILDPVYRFDAMLSPR